MNTLNLASTVTCPHCGFSKGEIMPTDACVYFYECEACKALLRPKTEDCCVFCSYGSVPCPPIQRVGSCCAAEDSPTSERTLPPPDITDL